jgi:LysR family hca operon transcriptional activator
VKEPLVVILPSDYRLAALKASSPRDLVGETFVGVSDTAPVLRAVIDNYLKQSGVKITPQHEVDHVVMGRVFNSVDGRRRAVTCLRSELSHSVCNESPSQGNTPTVDLVLGYKSRTILLS